MQPVVIYENRAAIRRRFFAFLSCLVLGSIFTVYALLTPAGIWIHIKGTVFGLLGLAGSIYFGIKLQSQPRIIISLNESGITSSDGTVLAWDDFATLEFEEERVKLLDRSGAEALSIKYKYLPGSVEDLQNVIESYHATAQGRADIATEHACG